MKMFLFAAFAFASISASSLSAQAADVCDFMPCGNYQGTGSWYDVTGKVVRSYDENIQITKTGENTVNIKVFIYSGTKGKPWADTTIEFQKTGQFSLQSPSGRSFGIGFCSKQVCNVAFHPVDVKTEDGAYVNAFVNTLRFEGNTLKRYNMVSNNSNDAELAFQRSTLTKK